MRLFLLDAYALIFRAYYGFINKPLVNSKGQVTSAIYGFTKTLQDVLAGQRMPGLEPEVVDAEGLLRPDCIAVCFDPAGGTFRHKEFPQYKAQRDATPEDIVSAVPWIKRILEAYRIPIIEVENYEADDVVGTMARLADESGQFETFMMSPDKDYAQLVTAHSRIFKPKSFGPGYEILDVPAVLAKYGLKRTSQVIDMLGLQGDTADNIPGCPGVGPKTAQKLIEDFDSVEQMIEAVETQGNFKFRLHHCCNAGGIASYPEWAWDMVRCGIILYGVGDLAEKMGMKPVMTVKTVVSTIKNFTPDTSISYGRKFFTARDSRIAVLPIGYADGLFRALSNKLKVLTPYGVAPQVGRICMDMCMVDITDLPDVKVGDEVEVFGETMLCETNAKLCETIGYELLCAVSKRVPRLYFLGGKQVDYNLQLLC